MPYFVCARDGAGHVRGHGVHGLGPVEDELGDVPVPPYGDELPEPPLARLHHLIRLLLRHDTLPVNAG